MKNGLFTILGGVFAVFLSLAAAKDASAWVAVVNDGREFYADTTAWVMVWNADNAGDARTRSAMECRNFVGGNAPCGDYFTAGTRIQLVHENCVSVIPIRGDNFPTNIMGFRTTMHFSFAGGVGETAEAALLSAREDMLRFSTIHAQGMPITRCSAAGESFQFMRLSFDEVRPSSGGGGSGGGGGSAGAIIGGVVAVGGLIWLYNANTPDLPDAETSFIPVAEYADGDLSVGGRLGWQKGRMSAFWKVGDSLHGSGLQYDGDFWTAAFSEKVQGETADYDLSLSADWTGGIWKVSPEFAAHSVYEKGEFATTNSFRINGELLYDDWRFSASGSKTQMHLSAVLEF